MVAAVSVANDVEDEIEADRDMEVEIEGGAAGGDLEGNESESDEPGEDEGDEDDDESEEDPQGVAPVELSPEEKESRRVAARAEVVAKIAHLTPQVTVAHGQFESAKELAASAKKKWEGLVVQQSDLCRKLTDIENGNFQPHLPFPEGDTPAEATSEAKAPTVDEHLKDPISVLSAKSLKELLGKEAIEHAKERSEPIGMTEKELEKLELADLATIGDLEQQMRDDRNWHQKIDGFGETKVNKLLNSLLAFRGKFPAPAVD